MNVRADSYNSNFFEGINKTAYDSAVVILPAVLRILPKINSVVDFGCGLGTWLSVLKTLGVNEIKGFDGKWVNTASLTIPHECFEATELDKEIRIDRKYDMAISLEVAEHLPEKSAGLFVKTLVSSSNIILFSAAIPFQGGTNHINEQWPQYWNDLFNEKGYTGIDYIRPLIWNEEKVSFWYKQNIILYVNSDCLSTMKLQMDVPPMLFCLLYILRIICKNATALMLYTICRCLRPISSLPRERYELSGNRQ